MGYHTASGRYADTLPITFASGSTITATTTGAAVELGDHATLRVDVVVSAASGATPSNTISVETSKDGSTGWVAIAAFTAITAAGSARKVFAGCDRFVRIVETITGTTPSFTRTISAEAV